MGAEDKMKDKEEKEATKTIDRYAPEVYSVGFSGCSDSQTGVRGGV